jgi:hypothetical protein
LEDGPTLQETVGWLCRKFVLVPHEAVAYSKYPDFTFRFRWEEGRLRFYTMAPLTDERFVLADDRRASMSSIAGDLGLWNGDDAIPDTTAAGRAFVEGVFG